VNRRQYLSKAASFPVFALLRGFSVRRAAAGQTGGLFVDAVLNDPDAPIGGNPNGDVTIVAFLDYNCPYCKRTAPDLKRFVSTDGKVRLVYKDWPILAESSVYGARLALGAKFQGQYDAAHAALMGIKGQKASEAGMREAVEAAGVDMAALDRDLRAHDTEILDLLKRNEDQAKALGLQGTPVYLIGPYIVASALDYKGFEQAVATFRAHIAK
jgi:protein-disulfide isomerase